MTVVSDKDGKELNPYDDINYTVELKNIGKTRGGIATYTEVNVNDFITDALQYATIEYNEFIINTEIVYEDKGNGIKIPHIVESYEEKTSSVGFNKNDDGGISTELKLKIPEGKTVVLKINGKVK